MLSRPDLVESGRRGRRLRVAVLCGSRAPGLLDLLDGVESRLRRYNIVCVVRATPAAGGDELPEVHSVPILAHPIRAYYHWRNAPLRDMAIRAAFDRDTCTLIAPYEPDLVLLDGYLYMVTQPMLDVYPGRILNLHFSDLTWRLPDGRPQFPGVRAVRNTLRAGENTTAATVHVVNDVPDGGAPIVKSWPFPVSPLVHYARTRNDLQMFNAYAFAHQQWMMRAASGPLLGAALALIAEGRVDLDALSRANPASVRPWEIDESGRLTPPAADMELAG